jgi:hypothetical protein
MHGVQRLSSARNRRQIPYWIRWIVGLDDALEKKAMEEAMRKGHGPKVGAPKATLMQAPVFVGLALLLLATLPSGRSRWPTPHWRGGLFRIVRAGLGGRLD